MRQTRPSILAWHGVTQVHLHITVVGLSLAWNIMIIITKTKHSLEQSLSTLSLSLNPYPPSPPSFEIIIIITDGAKRAWHSSTIIHIFSAFWSIPASIPSFIPFFSLLLPTHSASSLSHLQNHVDKHTCSHCLGGWDGRAWCWRRWMLWVRHDGPLKGRQKSWDMALSDRGCRQMVTPAKQSIVRERQT